MESRYPEKWLSLQLVPDARGELLERIGDVIKWNSPDSYIQENTADGLLDFLFDVYGMDIDCTHLVDKMIFPEELTLLQDFIERFDAFVERSREGDPHLDVLHTKRLPDDVKAAAENLYNLLAQSGLPSKV